MIVIEPATIFDIAYVSENMRDEDFREFSAVLPVDTRQDMTGQLVSRYKDREDVLVARLGEIPVAIGGVVEGRPNVVTLFMFATDQFKDVALSVTRFIKKELFPRLRSVGVHRIECISIEGHTEAHSWIELLGLDQETREIRGYGKRGESFIQFSWVSDDLCTLSA